MRFTAIPWEWLNFDSLEVLVERIEAECFWIVGLAEPLQQFLTFGMFWVCHGFDQVFVTGNTTAVFGRPRAGAVDASDDFVGDSWEELFDEDLMLPAVAKVVFVDEPVVLGVE